MKILFAEDGPDLMRLSGSLMGDLHLEVDAVTDGRSFIQHLSDAPNYYDLVVLGFDLPEISGRECIMFVRRMFNRLPILVVTDSMQKEILEELGEFGVRKKHIFEKTSSAEEFGVWVRQALSELPAQGSATEGGNGELYSP